MSDVSVVVSAHDERRWETLVAALSSVLEQRLRPREVILVVDHNEPLLARANSELQDIVVVENNQTRGLGGARNTGAMRACGSIVAFLDDDAIATPQWLQILVAPYTDASVAGVGGAARPAWATQRPAWFPLEFDWVVGCSYRGLPEATAEVRNFFGCNMSFRRELLDALGYFRLGYGCDETELCIRLRRRWPERKLLYVPDALIHHVVSEDRMSFSRFISRCYFEGGSKAVVAGLVGSRDALATERQYTRRILPAGVWQGIADAVAGDLRGLGRAGAIVAGLLSTMVGYAAGQLFPERAARQRGWTGGPLR